MAPKWSTMHLEAPVDSHGWWITWKGPLLMGRWSPQFWSGQGWNERVQENFIPQVPIFWAHSRSVFETTTTIGTTFLASGCWWSLHLSWIPYPTASAPMSSHFLPCSHPREGFNGYSCGGIILFFFSKWSSILFLNWFSEVILLSLFDCFGGHWRKQSVSWWNPDLSSWAWINPNMYILLLLSCSPNHKASSELYKPTSNLSFRLFSPFEKSSSCRALRGN